MILILTGNSGIKTHVHYTLTFLLTLMLSSSIKAQSWDFIKEKDGIKIYTRVEAGRSLKSYKAVTDINVQAEKIYALMEDINNTDWWDKKLTKIDVLLHESTGLKMEIQFDADHNYKYFENNILLINTKFILKNGVSITGNHNALIISNIPSSPKSVVFNDRDSLILFDEWRTGFEHHYSRLK